MDLATRPSQGLGPNLILINTCRVLRDDGIETLRSSVWQQQADGRWLMVFHQGTLAARDDEGTS